MNIHVIVSDRDRSRSAGNVQSELAGTIQQLYDIPLTTTDSSSFQSHTSKTRSMAGFPFTGKKGALHDVYMNTTKNATLSSPDIRMTTAKGMTMPSDISMHTARTDTTIRGGQFKPWERELLDTPEVRRKATAAQLCK